MILIHLKVWKKVYCFLWKIKLFWIDIRLLKSTVYLFQLSISISILSIERYEFFVNPPDQFFQVEKQIFSSKDVEILLVTAFGLFFDLTNSKNLRFRFQSEMEWLQSKVDQYDGKIIYCSWYGSKAYNIDTNESDNDSNQPVL